MRTIQPGCTWMSRSVPYRYNEKGTSGHEPITSTRRGSSSRSLDCFSLRGLLLYLETTAKLLKVLQGIFSIFSKCALKSLNNQTDFDSAIRRFDPSRPSQRLNC
jgi:hypothetical protein